MSYFAAAVVRGPKGWSSAEVDLTGAADIEEVADRLRDVDNDAEVSVMFVESDDVYLVILRLDEGEDLRVFGSDKAFGQESRLGALLLGDIEEPVLEIEDVTAEDEPEPDEEPEPRSAIEADADPVGDADLLADLGVPAHHLLELCAHEGMMPADVTAEVCTMMGCVDEIEELREA
ncbi:MAG TPA: tRNA adenosine deaminase-associated protein [Micromonosporaceae bacterium]